ncbi:unnamed protein product, partial [Prorocentrum cordatum]
LHRLWRRLPVPDGGRRRRLGQVPAHRRGRRRGRDAGPRRRQDHPAAPCQQGHRGGPRRLPQGGAAAGDAGGGPAQRR